MESRVRGRPSLGLDLQMKARKQAVFLICSFVGILSTPALRRNRRCSRGRPTRRDQCRRRLRPRRGTSPRGDQRTRAANSVDHRHGIRRLAVAAPGDVTVRPHQRPFIERARVRVIDATDAPGNATDFRVAFVATSANFSSTKPSPNKSRIDRSGLAVGHINRRPVASIGF